MNTLKKQVKQNEEEEEEKKMITKCKRLVTDTAFITQNVVNRNKFTTLKVPRLFPLILPAKVDCRQGDSVGK